MDICSPMRLEGGTKEHGA